MVEVSLSEIECCSCHITFWVTAMHKERLLSSKESFFCPVGHSMVYGGKTDAAIIKEKEAALAAKQQEIYDLHLKLNTQEHEIKKLEKKIRKEKKAEG